MTIPLPRAHAPDWYDVTPAQAKDVALVPGLRFDKRRQTWIIPRSMAPLLVSEGLGAAACPPSDTGIFVDGTVLRPHQVEGVAWMRERRGMLQADTMRIGKTGQIVATHDPASGPLVVVGPLATRGVWRDWMRRRWPDTPCIVPEGRSYDASVIDNARLIFLHYEVMPYWVSIGINRRIGTLVFDEAHLLSNATSKRTQNGHTMAPAAERIIVATGTPLWNKPAGLWSLMNLVAPASWGSYRDFTARYCGGAPGAYGWQTSDDVTNLDEFRTRIREVMIRRVWAELIEDLTPTKRGRVAVELTATQLNELDKLVFEAESVMLAAKGARDATRTVVGLMARYRSLLSNIKADACVPEILQRISKGPLVVWTWHKKAAEHLERAVREHGMPAWAVTGRVAEDQREGLLDAWRATDNGVMVMSLPIGQAGIDLSHAAQALFVELDWTPAVMGQAEMRTFTPHRGDEITYAVANHEIDERLAGVLAFKCERAKLMGMPASDTGIDILNSVLDDSAELPTEADLDGLALKILARVREEGTTFL